MFKVRARVWNPDDPARSADVELLVGTGATYTLLLQSLLERLGVEPVRTVRLRLADGRVVERPLGEVGIEVEGFRPGPRPWCSGRGRSTSWAA